MGLAHHTWRYEYLVIIRNIITQANLPNSHIIHSNQTPVYTPHHCFSAVNPIPAAVAWHSFNPVVPSFYLSNTHPSRVAVVFWGECCYFEICRRLVYSSFYRNSWPLSRYKDHLNRRDSFHLHLVRRYETTLSFNHHPSRPRWNSQNRTSFIFLTLLSTNGSPVIVKGSQCGYCHTFSASINPALFASKNEGTAFPISRKYIYLRF